jgi:CRISPR/Cas system-associated exonuclease Cas4 (RecB family)
MRDRRQRGSDFGYDWDTQARAWHRCSVRTGRPLTRVENAQVDRERPVRIGQALHRAAHSRRQAAPHS